MKNQLKNKYFDAPKYIVVNDNDPDLNKIILSLPKPPPEKYIEGYGLPMEDQRFSRIPIPRRLVDLESEAISETKKELSTNKNNVITLLKIQKTFWRLLKERSKEYKVEINFIRKCWFHRLHGFWFFNRGVPTYITGWHFYYLNFYVMSTDNGENRPEYRDRDMREFIFAKYCHETTETFAKLDKDGFAIKEPDGTYKMTDLGRRVCFGKMQPKNRRSGNTNKGLSNGLEIVTRTIKTDGMGTQSYSCKNAKSHFDDKLMPAFEGLPMWLKPNTTSGRTSDELVFNVGKNDYTEPSLQTKSVYATTASEKFFDGLKMVYLLTDEAGKTEETNVAKRHDVNKNSCSLGNGRIIFSYMDYPSTVSETAEGAHAYRGLSNTSNFYQRIKSTGQTKSGLFRLFMRASDGLEGFIDSYGHSVEYEIKDYQKKEGFTQTAHDYLQGKFDALIHSGDSDSMRLYREEKKLFPLKYEHCWLGESGDLGFNMEKIDNRLAELRRDDETITGRLEWTNGFFSEVEFVPDSENGAFELLQRPDPSVSNKKDKGLHFSTFEGKDVEMYEPLVKGKYVLGADPFRFGNKQDERIGKEFNKNSRLSDGGIAVFRIFDKSIDGGRPQEEWITHQFVLSYRHRARNTDEYNDDVLKAAVYFGALVFPETNVPSTYEYFIRKNAGGYLLYDIDKFTGQYKKKPGIDSLERSKQDLFARLRDYIENHCNREGFASFLTECKTIRGMEQMRHFDRLTAHGMCLLGANSTYLDDIKKIGESSNNLEDYIDFYDV